MKGDLYYAVLVTIISTCALTSTQESTKSYDVYDYNYEYEDSSEEKIPYHDEFLPPICGQCHCKPNYLDCSGKHLTEFHPETIMSPLPPDNLTKVDFSYNYITTITNHGAMKSLEVLNMSHNEIETIGIDSFENFRLEVLDLSNNRLSNIDPQVFQGLCKRPGGEYALPSISVLNLANNGIRSLPEDFFKYIEMAVIDLDLSGNPLTTKRETSIALSSLTKIKKLKLSRCRFSQMPEGVLQNCGYIEYLDLSYNQLTAVPQGLQRNLNYLNLNGNPIVELDAASLVHPGFPGDLRIIELHMSYMPHLKRIGDGALSGLTPCLRELHMSHNHKLSILSGKAFVSQRSSPPSSADYPRNIKKLDLSCNRLSTLDFNFLWEWESLDEVNLSDNPIVCNCTTEWMVHRLVPLVDSQYMMCYRPLSSEIHSMSYLYHTNWTCEQWVHSIEEFDLEESTSTPTSTTTTSMPHLLLGTTEGTQGLKIAAFARLGLVALVTSLLLLLLWRRGIFCPGS